MGLVFQRAAGQTVETAAVHTRRPCLPRPGRDRRGRRGTGPSRLGPQPQRRLAGRLAFHHRVNCNPEGPQGSARGGDRSLRAANLGGCAGRNSRPPPVRDPPAPRKPGIRSPLNHRKPGVSAPLAASPGVPPPHSPLQTRGHCPPPRQSGIPPFPAGPGSPPAPGTPQARQSLFVPSPTANQGSLPSAPRPSQFRTPSQPQTVARPGDPRSQLPPAGSQLPPQSPDLRGGGNAGWGLSRAAPLPSSRGGRTPPSAAPPPGRAFRGDQAPGHGREPQTATLGFLRARGLGTFLGFAANGR